MFSRMVGVHAAVFRYIYYEHYERRVTLRHSKGKRRGHCPHASSASALRPFFNSRILICSIKKSVTHKFTKTASVLSFE